MSFDLYVIHLKDGEPAGADRRAVLDAFDRYGNVERHGDGFYDAFFDDGSHVQFSAKGLETEEDFDCCAFHLRNFTFPIMRFIYEVAAAGDMMVVNARGMAPSSRRRRSSWTKDSGSICGTTPGS